MAKINGGIIGPNNPTGPFSAGGVWRLKDAFNAQKAGEWPLVLGYQIPNSLRFNSGSSDDLSRTPSSTTNRTTFTLSTWVKKTTINTADMILACGTYLSTSLFQVYFENDKFIVTQETSAGSIESNLTTTQLFRDVSAWYHLVVAIDTTQATASNRVKIYLNGSQITSFSTETYPSQNLDYAINTSSIPNVFGTRNSASLFFDGYMAETYLIDGQQLTPSSFGETDATTGIWIPKAYTGSFGTNGFYLKFQDSSALGDDTSGNGNDFTVNNLTSIDQSYDSPTNNFAIINALDPVTKTLTDGNLTLSASDRAPRGTIGFSKGKWYWECKLITQITATQIVGICNESFVLTNDLGSDSNGWGYIIQSNANNGQAYHNNVTTQYATFTTNDILNIAVDMDNQAIYFGKNGTYQNSGVPTSGASKTGAIFTNLPTSGFVFPSFESSSTGVISANFGYPPFTISSGNADANGFGNFEYAVPSGFYALCTKNLALYG